MIIDLHSRIWGSLEQFGREAAERLRQRWADRWEQFDGSPGAHEEAMHCVDGVCVLGFHSELIGAAVPNEFVAEYVAKDPRRRFGIAGIDPMMPGAVDEVDKAVSLGLVGVTISPAAQGFHPSHSSAMRLYERCQEQGLPIFVTNGLSLSPQTMLEFARPSAFDEPARSFPELPIVIGGLGYPWIDETLVLIAKHPNVFADLSGVASRPWQLYNALLTAAGYGVMEQIFFGSGFPLTTPARAIESLYSVNGFSHGTQLPSIPRSQIRAIIERDSLSILGIESELTDRPADSPEIGDDIETLIATAQSEAFAAEESERDDREVDHP